MAKYLLDTCTCISMFRNEGRVRETLQSRLPHNRAWLCTCQQIRPPYEFYLHEGFKPYKSERLRVGASAGMEVRPGLTWAYLEK